MREQRAQETVLTAESVADRIFPQRFEEFAALNPGAFRGKTFDMKPETPNQEVLFFTETATALAVEYMVTGGRYHEPRCAIRFQKNSPDIRFWRPQDNAFRDSDVLFVLGRTDGTEANEGQIALWTNAITKVLAKHEA
jgi:hypothetical protein